MKEVYYHERQPHIKSPPVIGGLLIFKHYLELVSYIYLTIVTRYTHTRKVAPLT
jgi:hypothetical protein